MTWDFLPSKRRLLSRHEIALEPRQWLPAPSAPAETARPAQSLDVFTKFGILPANNTNTTVPPLPVTSNPESPTPSISVWLPTVVIIIAVIAGATGVIGLGGSVGTGPAVPSTIDVIGYIQTIVIAGTISLDTSDVYPIFVSSMLWLFGLFRWLNPLAELVYADGVAYGSSTDAAALYRRDTTFVTVITGPQAPTYYGIERVALAGGIRPRNVFLIIFMSFLIIQAFVALFAACCAALGRIMTKRKPDSARWQRFRAMIPSAWLGMALRVWNIYYTPIVMGVAYQFILSARPEVKIPLQVTLIAAIACLATVVAIPIVIIIYVARTDPREDLFGREELLASLGPLYNTYHPQLVSLPALGVRVNENLWTFRTDAFLFRNPPPI